MPTFVISGYLWWKVCLFFFGEAVCRSELEAVADYTILSLIPEFSKTSLNRHTNVDCFRITVHDLRGYLRSFLQLNQPNSVRCERFKAFGGYMDDGEGVDCSLA